MLARRRQALVATAVLVLVTAACVQADHSARIVESAGKATTTTTAPDDQAAPTTGAGGEAGKLGAWTACGGLECTTLTVPLDWQDPGGRTIDVAVARTRATGDKIGSLLLNPGGPGGSGVEFLRWFADALPGELRQRFDLVSWDPRGTGRSIPVECRTDRELTGPDPDPTLDSRGEVQAWRTWSEHWLKGCTADAGDLLPYIGTWDTVRDLDALRAALGDERLTYIGYSYGSLLGTEYLRTYPDRTRAVVLDGIALADDPVRAVEGQLAGVEDVLNRYLRSCDRRSTCAWAGDDLTDEVKALIARVEGGDHLTTDSGRAVGPGELYTGIIQALYAEALWPQLDDALAQAQNGDGGGLLDLRDQYMGLQPDRSFSNIIDAFLAISCADQAVRGDDFDGDDGLRREWGARYPLLGEVFAAGVPGCHGFAASRHPVTPVGADGVHPDRPVVIIGNTDDGITPYAQAQALAELVTPSVLVTHESADHTAYNSGAPACLTDPVTRYLVDGTPPPAGVRC